jgi:hypothetical protein
MTNEPVLIGNVVTLLFALFGAAFARYGITEDDANELVALIGTVVSGAIVVISWIKQRSAVTPTSNPRNDEGTPLVPVDEAA